MQYVFVLDALNFCFWPLEGYEYEPLANSLKLTLEDDAAAFSAENLERLTAETLSEWLLVGSLHALLSLSTSTHNTPFIHSEALTARTPRSRSRQSARGCCARSAVRCACTLTAWRRTWCALPTSLRRIWRRW